MKTFSHISINMFSSAKYITAVLLLFTALCTINAQDKGTWNNKKCAVVFTYDDALNVHLDKVIPQLDSNGFKGTFYISGFFPGLQSRVDDWRSAAKEGHELGNHTLFHPCEGKAPGREWVRREYDLSAYTMKQFEEEVEVNNTLLYAIDGKKERTFAYACGDTKIGDSSFVPFIGKNFIGARGVQNDLLKPDQVDLANMPCYFVNGESADKLIELVKSAIEKNGLLVFLFHGVGGEHNLNTPMDVHTKLVQFVKQNEKDIWVAPLVDVSRYIKENNK